MLSKSGDSGHLCLASDFKGNVLNSVPLCIVLPIVLLHVACIMLRLVLSIASFFWDYITEVKAVCCLSSGMV